MWKKILLGITNLLSIAIILFSIMVLLTVILTKSGQAPKFMGYSLFRVMTGSMEPTLPTNTLIVVKSVDPSNLQTGDVISFYSKDPALQGAINTHRIVALDQVDGKYIFQTKGDANHMVDAYATIQEDVIGKVVFSSVALGALVRLLSNPLIFVPVIMIPLVIMFVRSLWEGFTLARKIAREEEEAAVREAVEALRQKQAQQVEQQEEQQQEQKTEQQQDQKAEQQDET